MSPSVSATMSDRQQHHHHQLFQQQQKTRTSSVSVSVDNLVPCNNNTMSSPKQIQKSSGVPHLRRRSRRGKKRRCHEHMMPPSTSQSLPQTRNRNGHQLKKRCIQIRPADVPQAPANFTQFIIDDHFGSCPGLYKSFETPPAGGPESASSDSEAPHSSVNYDSESSIEGPLDYSDMVAFYEKDFEEVYSDARAAEVIELPRDQLLAMYGDLEKRAAELSSELSVYSPQHLLELLQQRLLQLQEENRQLRAKNRALRYAHSEDSQGSVDSETDSSSSSSDSSESSDSSDEDGGGDGCRDVVDGNHHRHHHRSNKAACSEVRKGRLVSAEQVRHAQTAHPDCVNDNAMFQLGTAALDASEERSVRRRDDDNRSDQKHFNSNNEGSTSSTLDFRSFQDALFNQSPKNRTATTLMQATTSSRSQDDLPAEPTGRQSVQDNAVVAIEGHNEDIVDEVDIEEDEEDDFEPLGIVEALQSQQEREQEVQVTSSCKTPVSDSSPPYGEIEAMG